MILGGRGGLESRFFDCYEYCWRAEDRDFQENCLLSPARTGLFYTERTISRGIVTKCALTGTLGVDSWQTKQVTNKHANKTDFLQLTVKGCHQELPSSALVRVSSFVNYLVIHNFIMYSSCLPAHHDLTTVCWAVCALLRVVVLRLKNFERISRM